MLSLVLTPGQHGDSPQFRRVLSHIRVPGTGRDVPAPDLTA
jgi:hypothetical protein